MTRRHVWILLPVVLCALAPLIEADCNFEQTEQYSNLEHLERLHAKSKRFIDYGRDFLDFAKSSHSEPGFECEIANDLSGIAGQTFDRIQAITTLLLIDGFGKNRTSGWSRFRHVP